MSDIDILNLDANIRKTFLDEIEKVSGYKEKLQQVNESLLNISGNHIVISKLEKEKKYLEKHIVDLETMSSYNFYLEGSIPIIEEYNELIRIPVKVNFLGKNCDKQIKLKKSIVDRYINFARNYIDIDVDVSKQPKITCKNCGNKKEWEIVDNILHICSVCFTRKIVKRNNSSYNDIDRVNISSKYMYDPKIHFRDCIKQYQGKQNCTIPKKVYDDLEEQFERHYLLEGDESTPKEIRFAKITKNHIMMFLKELNFPKHYENVHLIHYNFTGIKPDDISHLEEKLLDDFDRLIELYHEKFKNIRRKNFINTQYVLYQLLMHHRHPCNKEEFIILKTVDRKFFHDEICRSLFAILGMNHHPFF